MPGKLYWASVFSCERPLEDILAAFNAAGPWEWQLRDSAWYGDYLNTRTAEGARVRIHEFPSSGSEEGGTYVGPGTVGGVRYERGFTALIELDAQNAPARVEIDRTLRGLLDAVGATNVQEIEPYD